MIQPEVTPATQTRKVALSIFVPFAAGYFASYLFRAINAVIADELVADVGLSANQLGLLTSAYFLAFAVVQLPVGILLDRFGPRRVEALLLLVAALGAVIFSLADSFIALTLGRLLIGVGVACCLMASFKAFALWFRPDQLPMLNGSLMAFGALGALAATTPVAWLLEVTGWRQLFTGLAAMTRVLSGLIFHDGARASGAAKGYPFWCPVWGLETGVVRPLFLAYCAGSRSVQRFLNGHCHALGSPLAA